MIEKLTKGKNPYLVIASLIFLVYFRSLFFNFTYLDDNVLILDNIFFLKNINNISKAFQLEVFHVLHSSAAYYRPMLTVSFIFDAQLSGTNPFMYHLTNILIHMAVSCLLFLFLIKLDLRKDLSLLFSALFAVHPTLTQAVSWIPGRNDSLLALYLLSSFLSLHYYLETKKNKWLATHSIFFALSVFTKESAVIFPVFLAYYLLVIKRKQMFSGKLTNLYAIWPSIAFVWFLMRSSALVNPVGYTPMSIIQTITKNSPAVFLFLGKVFFPINLSVLPILQDSTLVYGFVASLIIFVLAIISRKNYKTSLFGLAWFFLFLIPSFVRPSDTYTADFIEHRIYVPLIGLIIFFLVNPLVQKINLSNKIYITFFSFLIVTFSVLTIIHSSNFSNPINFWQNAVNTSPHHPLAQKNLGAMYYLDGDLDKAEKYYRQALELNPAETMVHNNLAVIYLDRKDFQNALKELDEEIKINPLYDKAHYNYGLVYWTLGEKEKAEKSWLKTLEINPNHTTALYNLAVYYKEIGEIEKSNYILAILEQKT